MTGRLVETSACTASGHATDEPAIPVMTSRRLNAPPNGWDVGMAMVLTDRRHIPAVPFGVPVEMAMRPILLG